MSHQQRVVAIDPTRVPGRLLVIEARIDFHARLSLVPRSIYPQIERRTATKIQPFLDRQTCYLCDEDIIEISAPSPHVGYHTYVPNVLEGY